MRLTSRYATRPRARPLVVVAQATWLGIILLASPATAQSAWCESPRPSAPLTERFKQRVASFFGMAEPGSSETARETTPAVARNPFMDVARESVAGSIVTSVDGAADGDALARTTSNSLGQMNAAIASSDQSRSLAADRATAIRQEANAQANVATQSYIAAEQRRLEAQRQALSRQTVQGGAPRGPGNASEQQRSRTSSGPRCVSGPGYTCVVQ